MPFPGIKSITFLNIKGKRLQAGFTVHKTIKDSTHNGYSISKTRSSDDMYNRSFGCYSPDGTVYGWQGGCSEDYYDLCSWEGENNSLKITIGPDLMELKTSNDEGSRTAVIRRADYKMTDEIYPCITVEDEGAEFAFTDIVFE